MKSLISYLRMNEWIDTKVPMLISVLLYFYWISDWQIDQWQFTMMFISYWCFFSFFLALGYVINDYADWEKDILAGKHKIMHKMHKSTVLLTLLLLIVLSIIPIFLTLHVSSSLVIWIIFIYILGIAYSVPPLRFKERGIWGLLVASIAQRCLPLMVFYVVVSIDTTKFFCWIFLSFLVGLRYILVHQLIDIENDKLAGIKTFVLNNEHYAKVGIYGAFILENVILIYLFLDVSQTLFFIICFFVFLYLSFQYFMIKKLFSKNQFESFICVPYEELYNIVIPITLLMNLAITERISWFCVLIFTITIGGLFYKKVKLYVKYFNKIIKKCED